MTKLLSFAFLFFFSLNSAYSFDKIANSLNEGGKIIFIRHSLAPGNGDPPNFTLDECSSQRNLNSVGIEQSIQIGIFFSKLKVPIDTVLTSEWCRCIDTAKYAFDGFKTFKPLNSFYDSRFAKYKKQQILELDAFLNNWNHNNKNLILITHYVVIMEVLGIPTDSGEIIIVDKSLNLEASIKSIRNFNNLIKEEKFEVNFY